MYLKLSDLVAHVIVPTRKHQSSSLEPEPRKKQREAKSGGQKDWGFKEHGMQGRAQEASEKDQSYL
jgi:hypothetical protein